MNHMTRSTSNPSSEQPADPQGPRHALPAAQRVVIKIGSAVLTDATGTLDRGHLHDLAASLAHDASLRPQREIIIVSSAAVAAGLSKLGLTSRPTDLATLQAAAAAGQPELMHTWRDALAARARNAAQMLLSRSDFDARDRFLNIRNCINHLLARSIIPIINENDSVATEEISLGDNDVLAAKLAVAVRAEALIILTSAPGVLDANDRTIDHAVSSASLAALIRPAATALGRGGMTTKLEAARIANAAGIPAAIAPGRPADALFDLLNGRTVGTLITAEPAATRQAGRRRWIELAATPLGTLTIDAGAASAITQRGASLLAKGITAVQGHFGVGDVVNINDPNHHTIARGLANLDASETRLVMGKPSSQHAATLGRQTHDEVVHRDNLVLL